MTSLIIATVLLTGFILVTVWRWPTEPEQPQLRAKGAARDFAAVDELRAQARLQDQDVAELTRDLEARILDDLQDQPSVDKQTSRLPPLALLTVLLASAIGLFFALSQPQVPDLPFAARFDTELSPETPPQARAVIQLMGNEVRIRPDNVRAWTVLISGIRAWGRPEQAEAALARARALNPDDESLTAIAAETAPPDAGVAPVLDQNSIAAVQAMDAEEQAAFIQSMIGRLAARLEADPTDAEAWLRLANARLTSSGQRAAVDTLKTALEHHPQNLDLLATLAALQRTETAPGEPLSDDALTTYRQILSVDPQNVEALFFTGYQARLNGDLPAAEKAWSKALSLINPTHPLHDLMQQQLDAISAAAE